MELYQVSHLSFGYYPYEEDGKKDIKGVTEVLRDLSFAIEKGSFVTLCGETGCGKSTLLRLLKKELQPKGECSGEILFRGRPFDGWPDRETASRIGFVMQNPSDQCVTDRVFHELAFGLENLGVQPGEIRRRVAEISAYFGMEDWYEKGIEELSGGQKQILNLAAVMAMRPEVLLLDEPTSQLDPVAAQNFLTILGKLNRELGITVILAEHRLEETFPMSDRVFYMEKGRLILEDRTREAALQIPETASVYPALPEAVRLFRRYGAPKAMPCPLTIGEGQAYLRSLFAGCRESAEAQRKENPGSGSRDEKDRVLVAQKSGSAGTGTASGKPMCELKDVWFRYKKDERDVLRGTSFRIYPGELVSLLGSNGSGKTTVLKVLAGILKPQEGKILIDGERKNQELRGLIGYLPQDVETLFSANTFRHELALVGIDWGEGTGAAQRHPYDLSGGEKQRLGMAKILAGGKKLLLLDEPTKGLDAAAKRELGRRLLKEKERGMTVLMVTHDLDFAASVSDRCGMLFRGELVSLEETKRFFRENRIFTTAASRIAEGCCQAVTDRELYEACDSRRTEEETEGK